MKNILILGAGFSAGVMIKYLLNKAKENSWNITVGDISKEIAEKKVAGNPLGRAILFDIKNENQKIEEISKADLVISFLPAFMHPIVAKECVKQGKHMVTASYVSNDMKNLDSEARSKGLALLNELGVDPGIDHMSAMRVIDKIKNEGGKLLAFSSNTGGLIAPEYDNNPWNYKFTWNPRNVVVAGQGVAKYIEKGTLKYIPYTQLFRRIYRTSVLNMGEFDVYANRDSLGYREVYGLQNIPTIFRGTMRRPGYCQAWDVFVQLGATDDTYQLENVDKMTYRDFINLFLQYDEKLSVEEKLCKLLDVDPKSETMKKLLWLGIFEKKLIGLKEATPAQVLQHLLEPKWVLSPEDKDLIVMQHKFEYELNGKRKEITSSLVVIGKDSTDTAMAITVGMPVAIAAEMLLKGQIKVTGVHVPVIPELYNPILDELEKYGIKFIDEERDL
ncbi:MAG: saccharopine dehydrogenase NADP-binding domain-containing protein [Bacteroidia bacterium]|nr:saccharopine dehydrogenase NADP-binding domain-containing protein [Bacteroidia bacterium]